MPRQWLLLILSVALLFALSASPAFAQATISFAQLNGTVVDSTGRTIAGASVSARQVDTNQVQTTTSNGAGYYALPNLAPGRYELIVQFSGFGKYTRSGITLSVGQTATLDVTLTVKSILETVVVTTEAPVIEPTRSEVSQVIDTRQIQDLPTSSRRFTDFALLTPGVATSRTALGTTFTEFEVTQISFGGMRSFSNEITVDGADFVNTISGVQRATPPQEAVQEFRVVNNSFGSDYGRALGGIVNVVTKSGTNNVHGTLYDYFQNSATNARTALQASPIPDTLRQNQFGGALGGPLKKDKTFYFLNYEGQRRAESPTFAPDLNNNIDTIDQAKLYLGLSPEGCHLAPAQCTNSNLSYLYSTMKTVHNDYGFARLDHQVNDTNRLALRYVVEDARDLGELIGNTEDGGGIGTPSGARNLFIRDQSLVGTFSSVLKPNLVNSALVQYSRRHYNFPGATGEPDLSVVNDLEFGHNFGTYDAIYESRMQFSDSMSWVKGSHVLQYGFDGNYVWGQNNYPGFTPARIQLPNLDCMNAFGNFVEGVRTGTDGTLPTSACPLPNGAGGGPDAKGVSFLYWGIAVPRTGFTNGYVPPPATGSGFGSGWPNAFPTDLYSNYTYTLNHGYWGLFAEDQWRVTPKLTFNYGMRWDLETGLGNHINSDHKGFQPRIGMAYSPDGKTVIRAGYGMFFDRQNLTFFFTTGNQKTIPGYLCYPAGADPSCAAAGATSVKVPMIQTQAASGGWQLAAAPGEPGAPAELIALGILSGAPYGAESLSGVCPPACGVGAGGIQRDSRIPYAQQASLEIDRQLGKGLTLQVGYLFVGAHRLVRGNNINVPCPAGTSKPGNPADVQGLLNPDGSLTGCEGTPTLGPLGTGPFFGAIPFFPAATATSTCTLPYQSPFPFAPSPTGFACTGNPTGLEFAGAPFSPTGLSAGLLDYNNNVANAVYHGLQVTAIERWGKYFNLTANYTFSHVMDNGNFTTFINLPQNQFDYTAERANSNQDARHHLVANFTATAPQNSFLRNFEFSSIVTVQSGRPFTLFAGSNVFGDVAGGATDRVGGPPVVGSCTSVSHCATTVRRNTYVGDPLRAWDARISRYFPIGERVKATLTVDAFNLLNRANVDEVTSVYGSPVFCGDTPVIPQHYNDATSRAIQSGAVSCATQAAVANPGAFAALGLLPPSIPNTPNAGFGTPRTMLNARQLQFSLKITF